MRWYSWRARTSDPQALVRYSVGNGRRVALVVVAGLAAMLATLPRTAESIPNQDSPVAVAAEIPEVLRGDTWLQHHRRDLMPYWDRPEALGEPLGNFPSFRGRDGELLTESPESTVRGLSSWPGRSTATRTRSC